MSVEVEPVSRPGAASHGVLAGGRAQAESSRLVFLFQWYWRFIFTVTAVVCLLGLGYGLVAPKWYRSQVVISAVRNDQSGGGLGAVAGGDLGGLAALAGIELPDSDRFKKESMARLASREFNYRFMADRGLLPILYARRWDAARNRWRDPAKAPTLEQAYKYFTTQVRTISEDRRTGLIKVTIDWKDPQLAQDWANDLVARVNADVRQVARLEAEQSLGFLNRELARTDLIDLRQAITKLIENEIRKLMIVSVREQYAFKVIDPAYLPGREGVVWPRPVFLALLGAVVGILVGLILASIRESRRPLRGVS